METQKKNPYISGNGTFLHFRKRKLKKIFLYFRKQVFCSEKTFYIPGNEKNSCTLGLLLILFSERELFKHKREINLL